jgi:anti-repressor protein
LCHTESKILPLISLKGIESLPSGKNSGINGSFSSSASFDNDDCKKAKLSRSMNELKIFENQSFGQIRTVEINGNIYFVASDIAKSLGYANPQKAIRDHCKGVNVSLVPSNGGNQEMNVIPEGDIYRLIARSNLPSAEKFESWVFDEVLPSIRKTGSYLPTGSNLLALAVVEAQRMLSQKDEVIAVMAPKAEMFDTFLSIEGNQTMNDAAKAIGIGRNKLFAFLREQKVLMKNNLPYQEYIDREYFTVREVSIQTSSFEEIKRQTLTTTKGVAYLTRLLKKHGMIA